MSGLLRSGVGDIQFIDVGCETANPGALRVSGYDSFGPVPNQLACRSSAGRSNRTPTRGQVQSQPGDGMTFTSRASPSRQPPVISDINEEIVSGGPDPNAGSAIDHHRRRDDQAGAPTCRNHGLASVAPTTVQAHLRRGVSSGLASSKEPRALLRSLSVGPRQSSSRGRRPPFRCSRSNRPVRASNCAGPSVIRALRLRRPQWAVAARQATS